MAKKHFPLSPELAAFICTRTANNTLTEEDRRHQVLLGRFPSEVLNALSIPDLNVVTSVSILSKLSAKHGLHADVIAGLHDVICQPLAVYKSATKGDSIVVVTLKLIEGAPLIAAIVLDTPDAAKKPNMHWLTSAYPKDNYSKLVEWEASGLLLWRP